MRQFSDPPKMKVVMERISFYITFVETFCICDLSKGLHKGSETF